MSPEIAERAFEDAIECGLLREGPDACAGDGPAIGEVEGPYGDAPGGYRRQRPDDYDRGLCLLPRDVVDFVLATQPQEWQRLAEHHGSTVREQFVRRVASEIERRGALDVLRHGIKDSGRKFRLAYFRPASGLNEETRRLHAAFARGACTRRTCSRSSASFASARRPRGHWTLCCSELTVARRARSTTLPPR